MIYEIIYIYLYNYYKLLRILLTYDAMYIPKIIQYMFRTDDAGTAYFFTNCESIFRSRSRSGVQRIKKN